MSTPASTADPCSLLPRSMRLHFGVLGFLLFADLCPGCEGQAQSTDPLESQTRAAQTAAAGPAPEAPAAKPSDGAATVSMRINRAPVIDNMTATLSPGSLGSWPGIVVGMTIPPQSTFWRLTAAR